MSLGKVTPGKNIPESFNVVIEIPMNADPVKYEVDKATGAITSASELLELAESENDESMGREIEREDRKSVV